jgi:Ser/Thr protein kinase RdoA (MazF antagonist)
MQKMNTNIFKDPQGLMENISGVTEHIRKKTQEIGGDVQRCSLVIIPTLSGDKYFCDSKNQFWRLYEFTEGTVTKEVVESKEDFYSCAEAFGIFQKQLADYPADNLIETITNFHNTPWRFSNLVSSAQKDVAGRASNVKNELEFAYKRKDFCNVLEDARKAGDLPLRVTHNDTKLNNILFDEKTKKAICVIDLDTVMPGYSVNDFGDSIRFGANTAVEDETDLSKVSLNLELFETYAAGFIKGCDGRLTEKELMLLPEGAIMMTFECGIRFLADYLDGDVYFKTSRPEHNLDRARNQFALVADMESKLEDMKNIIKKYVNA